MLTELLLAGAATTVAVLRPWRDPALLKDALFPGARRPAEPDPFEALRLQLRLHALADEINRLHYDETIFARAARLEASAAAYDDLLGSACRLAGVPETSEAAPVCGYATPTPKRLAGRELRAHRELQLAERGWSW
ncbi:hypothetical protein [Kineosporia babensis]|uniref:Uncharacterized protein n=1 Tax=Kineosporia babensis TaxID=499548 RepID=A0A9X1SXM0_9ACTN|nr:hypothetical protein [Kineosporia babensis]MCD5310333.1 hypothetical protein [Kineosporia babensis]